MNHISMTVWSDWLFRSAIFSLLLGAVVGKIAIGAGHGCLVAGLIFLGISGKMNFIKMGNLRGSALFLCGFIFFAAVSVLANLDSIDEPLANLKRLRYFMVGLILLIIPAICRQLEDFRLRKLLMDGVGISVMISIVFGLLNLWFDLPLSKTKENFPTDRLSGLDGEIISFAVNLQCIFLTLVALYWCREMYRSLTSRSSGWLIFFIPLIAIGIYFTYSRGAVLGLVVGILVFGLIQSRVVIAIAIAVGLILGLFAYHSGARYFNFEDDIRVSNWRTAALTAVKYPVFGVGLRNFETRSLELKEEFGTGLYQHLPEGDWRKDKLAHAHSNYLEAFATTGVFGGIAFLGFCFCWLVESYRSTRYRALLVPLIASFLTTGFFDCTFFDGEIVNTVILIYVFSQILLNSERRITDVGALHESS